ncbi:MAG: (E)-4-hydroxy-3-methylbut-2-enyl-diphosphate synthase [Hallerella porci]|uniref:4-hydroxy-3-methylbut-2-en-1-yl diphosphate synthase (flavodoxin) n=1 Tax=Hallerella porci TaxID=1945871 RepID=A0ABX5LK76_9BACT|nr:MULTISPECIES: (E)-4-hydroxy-3-methylbut-2-enyl-diphosphate synthase [Hallerella]MCI5599714.1 (E)-4-hydroxy-3-methylbut-2-enyl-diphosphate synthase [Hallerella sp.]MDY3922415.1 (E)-4-hydroxy-3-methylbut-2-enyl-diphosphate synthase [Hallerella porci]PWK95171.1 4-hydroxy-3-methylbut-2-en-1-yl diphosphate synthase [Hallerella porci]
MATTFDFPYVSNRFSPVRRKTIPVHVGDAIIGGGAPILVQSMTTTKPKDVAKTVAETLALAKAGCELVRITAPTLADAQGLEEVMKQIRAAGCKVPVSADIHFQPKAAFEALKWVEKVRINPGNFVDTGIATLDLQADKNFDQGREKVFETFTPFVQEAKRLGRAIRIGVNHGSLSARMMYRYGDTVEGMVESAMEYLAVCEAEHFDQVVVSLKSSTPRVAICAYRMLAARLEAEHFKPYPFHVGVTEAGAGEDGRLKSSVGIGSLLLDGLADTIRVSLTEDPVAEVPVAHELIRACALPKEELRFGAPEWKKDPYHYERLQTSSVNFSGVSLGGNEIVRVGEVAPVVSISRKPRTPEFAFIGIDSQNIVAFKDAFDVAAFAAGEREVPADALIAYTGDNYTFGVRALVSALAQKGAKNPILLYQKIDSSERAKLKVAAEFGSLLSDGFGDAVVIEDPADQKSAVLLAFDILQAAGIRRSKTEFISCPSCGRTLYNIQTVLGKIHERLGHLQNISIAVMGCIVNGTGEMADADFGYVGGAPGFINLFEGKTCVKKNVPEAEALDELVELIKSRGRYIEE